MKDNAYVFTLKEKKKGELVWNKCVYFDTETAEYTDKFEGYDLLNIRSCGITLFTLIVPDKIWKKRVMKYEIRHREITLYDTLFHVISYYDTNRNNTENTLKLILDELANVSCTLVGFNNEKFDNLIIEERLKSFRNYYRYCFRDGKESRMYVADLIHWAKAYGFSNLRSIGEYLNLPKLEEWNDLDSFIRYCERDTEILVHFLKSINDDEFDSVKPATEARRIMSSEFYKALECSKVISDVSIDHVPFFGGRTEPYYAVAEDCVYLDFNSLYPYVMSNFLFPKISVYESKKAGRIISSFAIALPYEKKILKDKIYDAGDVLLTHSRCLHAFTPELCRDIYEKYIRYCGCLKVRLNGIREKFKEYAEQIMFYFPFPHKHGMFTLFAWPKDEIFVEFYEILFLCFFDFEILEVMFFPLSDRFPNADKIKERYYHRRELKQKKDPKEKREKIILNSSYGIFATRNRTQELVSEGNLYAELYEVFKALGEPAEFEYTDGDEVFKIKVVQDKFYILADNPKRRYIKNSIPAFGIAITANARFSLYSMFLNAIFYKYRIFYCDTDSIFCDREMYNFLEMTHAVGDELGQMKLEKPNGDNTYPLNALFLAPKTYLLKYADGTVDHKFKGTGVLFSRDIISQSMKSKFSVISRSALNPDRPQKRYLKDNKFLAVSEPKVSEELKAIYEKIKDEKVKVA